MFVAKVHVLGRLACSLAVLALAGNNLGCFNSDSEATPIKYTGDAVNDFVQAVEFGDVERVSAILDAEPSVMELRDDGGQTAMHYAALNNRAGVIELLVERGMDPNVRDASGQTALTVLEDSGIRAEEARAALLQLGGAN